MITSKQIKDTATLVGAIAGIIGGADKIKTIFQKWKGEYHGRKPDEINEKESVEDTSR